MRVSPLEIGALLVGAIGVLAVAACLLWNRDEIAKEALLLEGYLLGEAGFYEAAIAANNDSLTHVGTGTELEVQQMNGTALLNNGLFFEKLDRASEAIKVYDEIVSRIGSADDLPIREIVAKALVRKADDLEKLGRHEEAFSEDDRVINRFGTAADFPLREQVAKALTAKNQILEKLGRDEEEIQNSDDIIRRFGKSSESSLREMVALALSSKFIVFLKKKRYDEVLSTADEINSRFSDAKDLIIYGLKTKISEDAKLLRKRLAVIPSCTGHYIWLTRLMEVNNDPRHQEYWIRSLWLIQKTEQFFGVEALSMVQMTVKSLQDRAVESPISSTIDSEVLLARKCERIALDLFSDAAR